MKLKYICESNIYMSHVHDIFKKLNLNISNTHKIGEGNNGIAFLHNDLIYKITADYQEVQLANLLIGEKLRRYVKIYDVLSYNTNTGEDNRYKESSNPQYYWIIIEEYINTNTKLSNKWHDAEKYFLKYINEEKFDFTRESFEKMVKDYDDKLEFKFTKVNHEDEEVVYFLKLLSELYLEFQKYSILNASDIKSAHLGIIENGDYKFFDMKLHSGAKKDITNIKSLN